MGLAVYGKHPAKGDFLEYGLPPALKPALEGWLDTVLAEAKASLGADWQTVWPAAPMLRFWLGEGIWGTPLAGVMAAAQDRVGRRFPLVLLALGDAGLGLPAAPWPQQVCQIVQKSQVRTLLAKRQRPAEQLANTHQLMKPHPQD